MAHKSFEKEPNCWTHKHYLPSIEFSLMYLYIDEINVRHKSHKATFINIGVVNIEYLYLL
jgi:hypothetical protein